MVVAASSVLPAAENAIGKEPLLARTCGHMLTNLAFPHMGLPSHHRQFNGAVFVREMSRNPSS